jgi:hypothetical protein
MRKQNHAIPPAFKHDSRLNNSAVPRGRRKRPNAQKHGVFAEPLILPGEDPREFEALHSALIEEWAPSGPRSRVVSSVLQMRSGASFARADLCRQRRLPTV